MSNKIDVINFEDKNLILTAAQSGKVELSKEKKLANKGIVEFTKKEIETMPTHFRKLLVIDNYRCRLRTHASGKNTITYEIRYRRNGYNISASGTTIELAKANFISRIKKSATKRVADNTTTPTTFKAFALFYFDTYRREKVSDATFRSDFNRYKRHLQPLFKDRPLQDITPSDYKALFDKLSAQGKGKTVDELRSLLNGLLKVAIAHGLIDRNPLAIIPHTTHERESGKALTAAEELTLKTALNGSKSQSAIMLLLYTGLRPNELKTVKIDDNFITAVNSKRKTKKKVEYKKIPIIKALRPFIPTFEICQEEYLRRKVKAILPNHKLYDLRTTFYTRCVENNVDDTARKLFVGHSLGALANAYTDVSDDYLLREAKKLDSWG